MQNGCYLAQYLSSFQAVVISKPSKNIGEYFVASATKSVP